jgi:hypothetical protein
MILPLMEVSVKSGEGQLFMLAFVIDTNIGLGLIAHFFRSESFSTGGTRLYMFANVKDLEEYLSFSSSGNVPKI